MDVPSLTTLQSTLRDIQSDLYAQHNTTRDESPTAIKGFCHENALYTARRLSMRYPDLPIWVVWGGLEHGLEPNSDYVYQEFPESIYELEMSGVTHFWIEIPVIEAETLDESETLVLDPFALTDDEFNHDLLCQEFRPDSYFRFPESIIEYQDSLIPDQLISEMTYKELSDEFFVFRKCDSCRKQLSQ